MQPEAEVGQLLERVAGARAGGARRRHDAEGRAALSHRRSHVVGVQAMVLARGHDHVPHAEQAQRPGDRRVALRRDVDHRVARRPLAGGGERDQARHRAAAHEHAVAALGQPAQLAQPVEHHELHRGRAGAAGPRAGEHVEARGGGVGEHRDEVARAADAGEEPRVVGVLDERQRLVEQRVERRVRVARLLRRRAAERRAQLGRVADPDRRKVADALEMLNDAVDQAVAEAAHLVGRQRKHRAMMTRAAPIEAQYAAHRSNGGDRAERHRRESTHAPRACR